MSAVAPAGNPRRELAQRQAFGASSVTSPIPIPATQAQGPRASRRTSCVGAVRRSPRGIGRNGRAHDRQRRRSDGRAAARGRRGDCGRGPHRVPRGLRPGLLRSIRRTRRGLHRVPPRRPARPGFGARDEPVRARAPVPELPPHGPPRAEPADRRGAARAAVPKRFTASNRP
jgi:hypothetical protein